MSGLLTRIRRRRSPTPQPPPLEPAPAAADTPPPAATAVADRPTEVGADPAPSSPTPAGAAPGASFDHPGFRARGQLRRRLRYLRRVRELGLRDVGGLVFDLDRFGRSRDDLVRAKLDALAAVDGELRTIEAALDEDMTFDELREIGIVACPGCEALLASEARYCSACGVRVDRGEARIETAFSAGGREDATPADDCP